MQILKRLPFLALFIANFAHANLPAHYCRVVSAENNRLQMIEVFGAEPTQTSNAPEIQFDRNRATDAWVQAVYRDPAGKLKVITRKGTASILEGNGRDGTSIRYVILIDDEAGRPGKGGKITLSGNLKGTAFVTIDKTGILNPIECTNPPATPPTPGPGVSGHN